VLEGARKVFIVMNVPENKLDAVVNDLPAMKRPTVSKLYKSDYYAVETVVSKSEINTLIPKLKALGQKIYLRWIYQDSALKEYFRSSSLRTCTLRVNRK